MDNILPLTRLLDTYQSLAGWLQALWLLLPPGLALALALKILLREGAARPALPEGELIYSIHCVADGSLRIERHGTYREHEPALLLVAQPLADGRQAPYRFDSVSDKPD